MMRRDMLGLLPRSQLTGKKDRVSKPVRAPERVHGNEGLRLGIVRAESRYQTASLRGGARVQRR